ncbi:MAG TPA: SMC-Scp complex subunit ScpB, partial [Terriglobia bacterium]|nr:SMC-Scp complex subunit ScpB [Terriglobia bacterium]
MSLKAKIEAVIYAAEEPVTLAQITALFQAELLEERAARLSAEAAPQEEAATEEAATESEVLLPEEAVANDAPTESPESAEDTE